MPTIFQGWATLKLQMLFPAIQTSGFAAGLRECVFDEEDAEDYKNIGFVPDAFYIDRQTKSVVIYEHEDSSRVSENKIAVVAELAWAIDEQGWSLELIFLDRFGNFAERMTSDDLRMFFDRRNGTFNLDELKKHGREAALAAHAAWLATLGMS